MTAVIKKRGSKKKLSTSKTKKTLKNADKEIGTSTAEKKKVEETAGKIVDLKNGFLQIKKDIIELFKKK